MIPAGADVGTVASIAETYGVSTDTVNDWARHPEFPRATGTKGNRLFPNAEADEWVHKHRLPTWLAVHPQENPLLGDPKDLLDPDDVARARAVVLNKAPVSAATISGYVSRGVWPEPDRRPHDGLTPPVSRNSWYRETVAANLPKGPGNRSKKSRHPAKEASEPAESAG